MKKIYFLLIILFGLNLQAQIVNIPDANFKAKLLSASSNNYIASVETPNAVGNVTTYNSIDANNNGEIEVSEAQSIKYLNVNAGVISNLTGIKSFTNLITLKCSFTQLTTLDLSDMVSLTNCYAYSIPLSTINLLGCNNIGVLDISYCNISTLDITDLINLKSLNCSSNEINNINLSTLNLLEILKCQYNTINTLDISQNTLLSNLDCSNNQLASLNLAQNINLNRVSCNNNQIIDLNFSQNPLLEYVECSNNLLTNLNTVQNSILEVLSTRNNQLTGLNVSQNTSLRFLIISSNQIQNIDISQNQSLEEFECFNNQLTDIDISQNFLLKRLQCGYNPLTNLNLVQNSELTYLNCSSTQVTSLDTSHNSVLGWLICENNILLNNINHKNGYTPISMNFNSCPNLKYICANDIHVPIIQQMIDGYGYTNCHVNSYCSFTPGGTFYIIQGNAKLDSNSNSCDNNDIDYKYLNYSITDGINNGVFVANQLGNYNIPVGAASHTITPNLENPTYFNISPTSLTVDFPTQASPFVQDFCVTANGVHSDVEIILLPTVAARPGFDAHYKIIYRNKGNQMESGAITFTYNDAVLDCVSANPVYNSQATDSFTWNYSNLQPFENREIELVFNVNSPTEIPAVNIDDVLNYTATITALNTDETPNDNIFTLNQTVVGSYDPNDKTCLEGETVGPDMIDEYVHYLIRFENTGTYPAENVVVKDMIDLAKFDLTTLIPLKGSHDFYTRIKDNKVEFIFENINLDFNDATNDGYVAFKIKTKSNLTVGSTFSNNANIYFDYNFPITTNTYTTTIEALSSEDFDFGSQFTLYPNPVKEVLNFNSKENLNIQSVEIYNMLGQIVISVPNATTSIDISTLTNGNYFVKVKTEKGSANTKFIKE